MLPELPEILPLDDVETIVIDDDDPMQSQNDSNNDK